ncbi:hypothetical protein [Nostoc sp. CCY 9925]|uniref:hypothetical protein n=1 Tax=Nostoc sp. CCY 9925 TaxID=3103865 RepID=UPI0039C623EB
MMEEELVDFLLKIVIQMSESDSDTKVIYPFLQENLDKLSLNFAELLRHWTKNYFAGESSYKAAQAVAGVIGNFGVLIAQFPHGNLADNLDIAIACCEVIEIIFNFDNFPKFWATSKMNLEVLMESVSMAIK